MAVYWIHDVMPQPWEVQAQVIGPPKWRKAKLISPQQLRAYKEELEAEFRRTYPAVTPTKQDLRVDFAFWRNTSDGAHRVDATNLLKATEDVVEGIIFHNDVNNRLVSSEWVEQTADTRNLIRIETSPYVPTEYDMPDRPTRGPAPLIEVLGDFDFDL